MRNAKIIPLGSPGADRLHKPARAAPPKPEIRHTGARLQSGALAYQRLEDGGISILVVSKRHSRKWGIPKGRAEADLSLAENAAKEAFEEAGVKGEVAREPLGSYRAMKRVNGLKTLIEVWVYSLEVTAKAKSWPRRTSAKSSGALRKRLRCYSMSLFS